MAAVFRGRHPVLERPVAIKRLIVPASGGPELARFLGEARIMASLSHPNLVQVYDLIEAEGVYHLVLEWVDGDSLRGVIERGRAPRDLIQRVLQGLLAGLGHAHRHGVVHRDVKPENVLLTADRGVKLTDFGIARLADSARPGMTAPDATLGTPEYMSPEQVMSSRVDHRSDLYSAGVVLHELAAGRRPFVLTPGASALSILGRLATEEAPIDSTLDPELRAVLARALARSPEARFQSAEDFAAALRGEASEYGAAAPPVMSISAEALRRAGNLPEQLNAFVGRAGELAEVRKLLEAARLVTVTGAGGVGKTRFALEVAAAVAGRFPDGAWLVALAPVGEAELVPQAVASVLGVAERKGAPLVASIVDWLRGRRLLLVIDNCEHLVESCAGLATELLAQCPELRILATSQERLAVPGEQLWAAPGLSVADAVALFEIRARAAAPGFEPAAARPDIEAICVALEGAPLAIELAAARVRLLAPKQLRERLHDRFRSLDAGVRTGTGRHRTLRAAVEWSYALLETPERELFNRLSVFAGGFRLEDAEAIAAGDPIQPADVLGLLGRLVDKSLVTVEPGTVSARYRLLETLRQYGAERLAAADAADSVGRRHAERFTELAEAAALRLRGGGQEAATMELTAELDNLRAALAWTRRNDPDLGLRLAASLGLFWVVRSLFSEGRAWLTDMLAATTDTAPARVAGLISAGRMAQQQFDHAAARDLYGRALALAEAQGDDQVAARALHNLATILEEQGDYQGAHELFERSLAVFRASGDLYGVGTVANNLGNLLFERGDVTGAQAQLAESLAVRRQAGDIYGVATSLGNLGTALLEQGQPAEARRMIQESLELRGRLGDRSGEAYSRQALADVELQTGNLAAARSLLEDVIRVRRELGERPILAGSLELVAQLAVGEGDGRRALVLLGAAARLRKASEAPLPAIYRSRFERVTTEARRAGGDTAGRELDRGQGMDLEAAVRFALGEA